MHFNVNVTGSTYIQAIGIIDVSVFNGTPPYLIKYRNFDGSLFSGLKIDDGLYVGYPEYTKAINVPIGFYFVDVVDNYGAGVTQTECVVVGYVGNNQLNIDNTPPDDIITIFPCIDMFNLYWLQTEDGCYINLNFNDCSPGCFLIGGN